MFLGGIHLSLLNPEVLCNLCAKDYRGGKHLSSLLCDSNYLTCFPLLFCNELLFTLFTLLLFCLFVCFFQDCTWPQFPILCCLGRENTVKRLSGLARQQWLFFWFFFFQVVCIVRNNFELTQRGFITHSFRSEGVPDHPTDELAFSKQVMALHCDTPRHP